MHGHLDREGVVSALSNEIFANKKNNSLFCPETLFVSGCSASRTGFSRRAVK